MVWPMPVISLTSKFDKINFSGSVESCGCGLVKPESNDFAQRISYDFDLSGAMWQRAKRIRSFGSLVIRDASLEDIFIMKLIANRPGRRSGLLQAGHCRPGLQCRLPGDRSAVP
mgnify:FL=1